MPSLDSTLGPVFLGNILASILYGIVCFQAFIYLKRGNGTDNVVFRRVVCALWLLTTLHLAFISHALYYYMISNYGNPESLLIPTWTILAQVFTTSVNNITVRSFFARRVWLLTGRNAFLTLCIVVPSFGTFACSIAFSTLALKTRTFENFSKTSYLVYLIVGFAVVSDSTIAATLCIALRRSRTGFPKTDTIVNTLLLYVINTGLLTCICSVTVLLAFVIRPTELIFLGFYFLLSNLYLNSLLATLNAQDYSRDRVPTSVIPIGLANMPPRHEADMVKPQFPFTGNTMQNPDDRIPFGTN